MSRFITFSIPILMLFGLSACNEMELVSPDQQSSEILSRATERVGVPGSSVSLSGDVVATSTGQLLYTRASDPVGGSTCNADCLEAWTPYLVTQTANVQPPFETINTQYGVQWAYSGKPLYVSKLKNALTLNTHGFQTIPAIAVLRNPKYQFTPAGTATSQATNSVLAPAQLGSMTSSISSALPNSISSNQGSATKFSSNPAASNLPTAEPFYGGFDKPQPFLN